MVDLLWKWVIIRLVWCYFVCVVTIFNSFQWHFLLFDFQMHGWFLISIKQLQYSWNIIFRKITTNNQYEMSMFLYLPTYWSIHIGRGLETRWILVRMSSLKQPHCLVWNWIESLLYQPLMETKQWSMKRQSKQCWFENV